MKKVCCCGVWDLFHIGHLKFLAEAAWKGDALCVGVETDGLAASRKGELPIICCSNRMKMLDACELVAKVVAVDDYIEFIEKEQPDVYVVGEEYIEDEKNDYVYEWLMKHGVPLVFLPYYHGVSTSAIIKKCAERYAVRKSV